MRTGEVKLSLTIMWAGVITFLLAGSSQQFAGFAPFAVPQTVLYAGVVISGVTIGFVYNQPGPALIALGLVLVVAIGIHAIAMVFLPLQVSEPVLYRLFVVQSIQRSAAYLLYSVVLGGAGLAAGLAAAEFGPK